MSLLTIANDILRETGFSDVSTLVGNGNQTARLLLAEAQKQGKLMSRAHRWKILTKRYTFTTVSSAETYSMPNDFWHFINDTVWNTSEADPMRGPVSDERWQANKSGIVTTTVHDRFQIRADGNQKRLYIDPVPTSAEDISLFYISDEWCRSKGGQRQSEWKADDDELLLDELVYSLGLKARFLKAQKREWREEFAEYLLELNKAKANDGGAPTLRISPPGDRDIPFVANIPETGFGS